MRIFPDSTTPMSTDINGKSPHPEMNEKRRKKKVMNPTRLIVWRRVKTQFNIR